MGRMVSLVPVGNQNEWGIEYDLFGFMMSGILLNLLAATAGGQVTRAEAFLHRFRLYNPNVRLVILKDCQTLSFCDETPNWEVKNISIGNGRFRALRRMAWENVFLPSLMRTENLDVYLTFSHFLPMYLGSNVRSIVGVSNLAPFSKEAWDVETNKVRLKMWLQRCSIVSSANRAEQVIALSNTCKRVLIECGVDQSKITVIPNGVEFCQSDSGGNISPSPFCELPYILSVSHFHRYKNFSRLVEAYGLLPESLRQKYRLVIVGKPYDVRYFEEIQGLIARLKLESRVYIIPGLQRVQLDWLYRKASLFVFTSLIENSPNILLEAMAYGLPVLASNVEPMPEFGGEAIRYFDGLSSVSLAERMAEMLSEDELAANFGRRAAARSAEYSWDVFTKKVLELCCQPVTCS